MTHRSAKRIVAVLAAPAGSLLMVGCNAKSPNMLHPAGSESAHIAGLWWLMFALGSGVYGIVGGFIIWAVLRGRRGAGEGKVSDDAWIIWGGIGVPIVILMVLAVATVKVTSELRRPSRNELNIEVQAKDWYWSVSYTGYGFATANEIHLPVGQPVAIGLDSDNVIHSFWVPQLAGKLDAIPGQHNVLRFTPQKVGTYEGECAEFCGIEHARMGFLVIVQTPAAFQVWATEESTTPLPPDDESAADGQQVFMSQPCAGCHTIRGTQAQGTVGPDLTDVGGRETIGGDLLANTPATMKAWISDAQASKPGALMPPMQLSTTDLNNLVIYLEGLKG